MSDVIAGGELIAASSVISTGGVGIISVARVNGGLCGSGDMSIVSWPYPGEDDGIGGVVTPSHRIGGVVAPSEVLTLANCFARGPPECFHGIPLVVDIWKKLLFDVNSERRGVGNCGLL